jgi:hypothetical protein
MTPSVGTIIYQSRLKVQRLQLALEEMRLSRRRAAAPPKIPSVTRQWNPTLTSKSTTLGWGTRKMGHPTFLGHPSLPEHVYPDNPTLFDDPKDWE